MPTRIPSGHATRVPSVMPTVSPSVMPVGFPLCHAHRVPLWSCRRVSLFHPITNVGGRHSRRFLSVMPPVPLRHARRFPLLSFPQGSPITNVGDKFSGNLSVFLFCPFIRVAPVWEKTSGFPGVSRLSFPQVFSGNPGSFSFVPSFVCPRLGKNLWIPD